MDERETSGLFDDLGHKFQTALSISTELITSWRQREANRFQQLQYEAQQQSQASESRLRAQRRADQPIMRQVWSRSWWKNIEDPEDIGHVWEVAAGWARADDPAGVRAIEEMRHQIKTRYGVDIDPVSADSAEVISSLANAMVPNPRARESLETEKAAAALRGESPDYVVKAALIRNEIGDKEWWASAPDDEIVAVVQQVRAWPSGRTKNDLLTWIHQQSIDNAAGDGLDIDRLLFGTAVEKAPAVAPGEPGAELGPDEDPEAITRQDRENEAAIASEPDEEFREQITAAALLTKGNPPSSLLRRGALQRLGLRRPRISQRSAETEVAR